MKEDFDFEDSGLRPTKTYGTRLYNKFNGTLMQI